MKFILLTAPRSGSSFLRQSLQSHPSIQAFGELFITRLIRFNTPGFDNRSNVLRRFRDERPVDFLQSIIFGGYRSSMGAVGFKVFYSHLDKPPFHPVRDYLASLPGLRVIHLKRRNLLRAYLSSAVMAQTGVSGVRLEHKRQLPSVVLDPKDGLKYFEERRREEERYQEVFAQRDGLTVTYEDLAGDYESECKRVLAFLDVEQAPLSAKTIRHETRPLREAITNYDHLRDALSATPYAVFFDD